jgi:hypothetical protein
MEHQFKLAWTHRALASRLLPVTLSSLSVR